MSDDYDKIAELVRNGYSIDEALNQIPQTDTFPSATTSVEGGVILATDAEVTAGTDTSKVPPVSAMVAHQGIGKAWVSFNGTGTVAIEDSFNVTSITDNGVGDYTVSFTTNMADTNYAVLSMQQANGTTGILTGSKAVGSVRINAYTTGGAVFDPAEIGVLVVGAQ